MNQKLNKDMSNFDVERIQQIDVKFSPAKESEVKDFAGKPEGFVAGWASTPDLDYYKHVVAPGAFDKSISEKGLTGPEGIKLLLSHDRSRPAGVIQVLETRGQSLWIEAQLNLEIGYVRDMYLAAKMNDGLSFSVGFYLEDYEFKQNADKVEYLQINKGELEEVSMVVFPGNPKARNTIIKDRLVEEPFEAETMAELEKALVADGLAKSRNEAQRLTRWVKKNAHLFPTEAAVPPSAPVAKERMDRLSSLLLELRNVCE